MISKTELKSNGEVNNHAKEWCKRLNIKYDNKIDTYYTQGIKLFNQKDMFVIDKNRLTEYNKKYNIFRKWFEDVLLACDDIAQSKDLLIYIYTLIAIMMSKENVAIFETPNFDCRATDYAPLFSFMYFLDEMIDQMKNRGCSHQIISDTLYGFDSEMDDYYQIYGRSGMRIYIAWFMLFLRGNILRIGRLQFEIRKLSNKIRVYQKDNDIKILMDGEHMHRKGMVFGSLMQTDRSERYFAELTECEDGISGYMVNDLGECIPNKVTLKGYKEILKQGDYVISVHIPSGGSLDYNECEKSYEEAEKLFFNYYSEYNFKAFTCFSWMMEKRLKSILGKETNITKFADEYTAFPYLNQGSGIYFNIYNLSGPVSPDALPENTSLQKGIKSYLAEGNAFYEKGGIRLFKNSFKR